MRTGRTRLPLVEREGDLDSAIGVINAKDLLPAAAGRSIGARIEVLEGDGTQVSTLMVRAAGSDD